jgi:hypothetical protein
MNLKVADFTTTPDAQPFGLHSMNDATSCYDSDLLNRTVETILADGSSSDPQSLAVQLLDDLEAAQSIPAHGFSSSMISTDVGTAGGIFPTVQQVSADPLSQIFGNSLLGGFAAGGVQCSVELGLHHSQACTMGVLSSSVTADWMVNALPQPLTERVSNNQLSVRESLAPPKNPLSPYMTFSKQARVFCFYFLQLMSYFALFLHRFICVMLSMDGWMYGWMYVTKCIVTKLQMLQTSPLAEIYLMIIEIDLQSDVEKIRHFGRRRPF